MKAIAVPASRGSFTGSLSTIILGSITLEIIRSAPLLLFETAAEDRAGFKLMLDGSAGANWDGRPVKENDVALFGDGEQHEAAYRDAFACALVSFPAGPDPGLALPDALMGPRHDGFSPIRSSDPQAHARMVQTAREAERAAEAMSGFPSTEEVQRSLRAALLDSARRLLAPTNTTTPARRQRASGRQRIVRSADEYLCAKLARPIYTDDICAALGVSESSLHEAFQATFGLSPHRYLKLRRLSLVRTMLLSRSGRWHSVKAVALSHGFWHLGQFACDYREVFGESPSDTLARAR